MSGHSKWSKIKHQKAVGDAKKSTLFSKMSRLITVAAREGGDPNLNFKLRLAIDSAKAVGVPKENIERAIKRGTGEDKELAAFEEVIYEGFGPGGVALMIYVVTDNKNRAISEIKHILNKYGGSLAGSGSVSWMFSRKGTIRVDKKSLKDSDILNFALEVGADDYNEEDETVVFYTKPEELQKVQEKIKEKGVNIEAAEVEFIAKEPIKISDPQLKENLEKMFEELDENEDVNDIFTNIV